MQLAVQSMLGRRGREEHEMTHYEQEWNRGFDQGWEEAAERGYWMEFCTRWGWFCSMLAACALLQSAFSDPDREIFFKWNRRNERQVTPWSPSVMWTFGRPK
jgi:hypothetical protein